MSFTDLYESAEHRNQLAHFAAIVNLAATDGAINEEEQQLIERFARKLNITKDEYKEVLKNPANYPINPPVSQSKRLERIFDLFGIIYADHQIDEPELKLLNIYVTGLGFTAEKANVITQKSMRIFEGRIDFEDYLYLLDK